MHGICYSSFNVADIRGKKAEQNIYNLVWLAVHEIMASFIGKKCDVSIF